jgi:geranylgeranyl reductase family protein
MNDIADVLVVGAGPAGAAVARRLAEHGANVVVLERRSFPRSKACGDSLTPRAVAAIDRLGAGSVLDDAHITSGLRISAGHRSRDLAWPRHPEFGVVGAALPRRVLDERLAAHAVAAGATLLDGHEAVEPIVERGFVRGAVVRSAVGDVRELRAGFLVVADGANSTFGRALGTSRTRGWPYGTAIRGYYPAARHDDSRVEIGLELTDREGTPIPGYGWVVPLGDGTVNVGVTLLSTARDFRGVNTARLLEAWAARVAERWGFDPAAPEAAPAVGRLPMGGSVEPKAGPTFVVVGDAAGTGSPVLGNGIEYALESGLLAADVLVDALGEGGPTALQRYPRLLAETYGDYWKLARLWSRALGHPTVVHRTALAATGPGRAGEVLARFAANALRPDDLGPAEALFGMASRLARFAPDA